MKVFLLHPLTCTLVLAIVAIVVLEVVALVRGVDGIALAAAIGAVGAIGGYIARTFQTYARRGADPEAPDTRK